MWSGIFSNLRFIGVFRFLHLIFFSNVPVKNLWLASSDLSTSKAFSTKITSRLRSIFLVSGLYSLYPFPLTGYPTNIQGIYFLWSFSLRFSSEHATKDFQDTNVRSFTVPKFIRRYSFLCSSRTSIPCVGCSRYSFSPQVEKFLGMI